MAPFAAITTHCVDNYNTSSTYILRFFSAKWKGISKKNQEKQRKIRQNMAKTRKNTANPGFYGKYFLLKDLVPAQRIVLSARLICSHFYIGNWLFNIGHF
jgi:hypothetical protein